MADGAGEAAGEVGGDGAAQAAGDVWGSGQWIVTLVVRESDGGGCLQPPVSGKSAGLRKGAGHEVMKPARASMFDAAPCSFSSTRDRDTVTAMNSQVYCVWRKKR